MDRQEKMSLSWTEVPRVTPIRAYRRDNTDNYSRTWFGDQRAQSRFGSLGDYMKPVSGSPETLQLDHLYFPPSRFPPLKPDPGVKLEPYEKTPKRMVPNEHPRPQCGYSAMQLEPNEFPTVNVRDLGSNVLQVANADHARTPSKETDASLLQYLQNNPQTPLPLREPLVDMTKAFSSLNYKNNTNGSNQTERTPPNKIPMSQYLPVLWKSMFDSPNTKVCSADKEKGPSPQGVSPTERPADSKQGLCKRSRKLQRPVRSARRLDPNFRGATVVLHTEVKNKNCSLTLSASFSNVKLCKRQTCRKRKHSGSYSNADTGSGSDDENVIPYPRDNFYSGKTCASCGTHRTPLWRDADDGTPLCNACGIRFKKYRIRCSACWHIPKKDIKTYPKCPHCGASLRVSFAKRHPW